SMPLAGKRARREPATSGSAGSVHVSRTVEPSILAASPSTGPGGVLSTSASVPKSHPGRRRRHTVAATHRMSRTDFMRYLPLVDEGAGSVARTRGALEGSIL